ncbi:protoglobin domain-containing protein [Microbaculum sp. FT89]|uniref:protoglobin domain-containing protein n=1 Tax=Microbaculum sp. FT89 TaxID=3447298 RepID=UPI003F52BA61
MESSAGIAFLDFTEKDRRWLHEAYDVVRPLLDTILDEFYRSLDKIDSGPETYGVRREDLKKRQKDHWHQLFQGSFDETYENTARRIAIRHLEIGLPQDLYVLSYLKILSLVSGAICGIPGEEREHSAKMVEAVTKAIAIDMVHAMAPYSAEVL